jgi:signal transduction histidine kinase/ligand-binding sensor domain-containing protein
MIKSGFYKIVLILLLYAIFVSSTFGQERLLNFFRLDYEYGLSDNHVNTMVMDHDGFLWVGTYNGLNRFDGYTFKIFKHNPADKSSIPDNQIHCLLVTSNGTLYVGTSYGGICKYNPGSQNFEMVKFNPNQAISRETIINGVEEDVDQNLWIATNKGLYFSEHGTGPFQWYTCSEDSNQSASKNSPFLLSNNISGLKKSPSGGIWLSFDQIGLVHYNRKTNDVKAYKLNTYASFFRGVAFNNLFAENDKLWIGTDKNGALELNLKNGEIKRHTFDNIGYSVHYIFRDSKGLYWVCTDEGLFNFDNTSGKFTRFVNNLDKANSISSTSLSCMLEDSNGMLWIGAVMGGINYTQRNKPFDHYSYKSTKSKFSLKNLVVSAMLSDSKGGLWIGYDLGGVEYFDFSNSQSTFFQIPSYKAHNPYAGTVAFIFEDSRKELWLGAWQGGLQKFNQSTHKFEIFRNPKTGKPLIDWADIRGINEDLKGNLWLCIHGNGVAKIKLSTWEVTYFHENKSDKNALCGNWTFDISVDKKNRKWIASSWGISQFSSNDSLIKTYRNKVDNPGSLTHNYVNTIYCDLKGRTWIGTAEGLNLYDEKSDTFIKIKIGGDNDQENVKAITSDNQGDVWISTNTGIERIHISDTSQWVPQKYMVYQYNFAEGLQSLDFMPRSVTKNHRGELFFGGSKGIDFFLPKDIKDSRFHVPVYISDVLIHNKLYIPNNGKFKIFQGTKYTLLHYLQNNITFNFVGIDYVNCEKINYQYKLEGFDTSWYDAGNIRTASFTNLNPGKYSFKVIAVGQNNEHSIPAVYNFYIKPPFWKTYTFTILGILSIIFGVVVFTNRRISSLKHRKLELEHTVTIRTEEVQIKNKELIKQTENLNEINTLLEEKQQHIEEQTEELRAQAEELGRTNKELNYINKTKDKLFSIIAHDLKNPFNIILGFSDLLLTDFEKRKIEDNRKMAGLIKESAVSAYQLLENLLYWSQSQRNKIVAQKEKFDLANILEEVSSLLKEQILRKEIDYAFFVEKDMHVYADFNMINTVLRNLLANAIKFTSKNGVIRIKIESNENFLKVAVTDNGIGIQPEKLANLFQVEHSGSEKGTEGEQGTGLGLVICKEFVENNGGEIWVESKPRMGSTFFFTIPKEKL